MRNLLTKCLLALFLGLCLSAYTQVSDVTGFFCHKAEANYPDYLNVDRNYIRCDGHMGTAWYVVASSLNVEKYEPPQYIISVDVVSARSAIDDERDFYENGGSGKIMGVKHYRFFYNWNLRRMYYDSKGNNDWRYLDPNGDWAHTGIHMPAGHVAFLLAYNLEFYSGYKNLTQLVRNR